MATGDRVKVAVVGASGYSGIEAVRILATHPFVELSVLTSEHYAGREVADVYRHEFTQAGLTDRISLPSEPYRNRGLTNHHIYHQYVIRTSKRDALREHLTRKEIGTAIYYPVGLHQQDCFSYLGYKAGDLPETERAAAETLALPIYPELSQDAQRAVVGAISDFLAR
jgi:dTDP-4-amino-4,6-dideoxygalactose transaminase